MCQICGVPDFWWCSLLHSASSVMSREDILRVQVSFCVFPTQSVVRIILFFPFVTDQASCFLFPAYVLPPYTSVVAIL
jgi:hypothetical protein